MAAERTLELTEVDVRPTDIGRFESIGRDRAHGALPRRGGGAASRARRPELGRERQFDCDRRRGGRAAPDAARLRARRRHRRALARDRGRPAFFEITKRIHNRLYGTPATAAPLGDAERRHYERDAPAATPTRSRRALRPATSSCSTTRRPPGSRRGSRGGCARRVALPRRHRRGERVVGAGVGVPAPVRRRRRRLRVLARSSFAPRWVDRERLAVIPPSIDPFSPKNAADRRPEVVTPCSRPSGSCAGDATAAEPRLHPARRLDRASIDRPVDLVGDRPAAAAGAPIVLQASRWDA